MPDTPQQLFESLTLKQIEEAVNAIAPGEEAEASRLFYEGDHWQNAEGWIGATPPTTSPQYAIAIAAIEASQVSENVIREVVDRHVAGILSREPSWRFTPRRPLKQGESPADAEVAKIDELESFLTIWWDNRRPHEIIKDALINALLGGRGPVRISAASESSDESGNISAEDFALALDMIYVDAPDPGSAAVLVDAHSRREIGAYLYDRYPNSYFLGVTPSGSGEKVAEISYINDDGTTALRVINSSGVVEEATPPLLLNRHILQYDLRRPSIISNQIRQLQKSINLTLTQMLRNVNLAGSLERVFVNAMPPGEYVDSEGRPWVEGRSTGTKTYRAQALQVGAGMSAFLRGIEVKDKDGNVTGYANASINYRDPVPVDTFKDSRNTLYMSCLGQVGQLHALISGDATATGESRKQARAEFETSLTDSAGPINNLGRWLLETVASLAAIFSGSPGKYDDLRCEFNAIVDAGPLSAEDRRETVNEFSQGVFSHETTLSKLDCDDVDAELAKIAAEDAANAVNALGTIVESQTRSNVAPGGGDTQPVPTPTPSPVPQPTPQAA